ncbi:MAG TPA: SIR2 family protein [Longimicrobium sp.]
MRILMSYSPKDSPVVGEIAQHLIGHGHNVWVDWFKPASEENIIGEIRLLFERVSVDAVILVASKNSFRSADVQRQFSAIAFQQVSNRELRIILVRIDHSEFPGYLPTHVYIDMAGDFESGLATLTTTLDGITESGGADISTGATPGKDGRGAQIRKLREAFGRGRLTLVCGAGVSVEAGIPSWRKLLVRLLRSMMHRIAETHALTLDDEAADEFDRRHGSSSLIVGKYLKNTLGNEFLRELRDALYAAPPGSSKLLECIGRMVKPERDRLPFDSIITFNFDDLIEETLRSNGTKACPIYSEELTHKSDEIPIYHVHGYLPRQAKIPETSNIVFSEDAYHSQFIDPFSWSNLIQLTKLTHTTCLLVGISLKDPNLRRLLDVAMRRRVDKTPSHYILREIPRMSNGDGLDRVAKLLEEQDANTLGLNVIWFNYFPEIPAILDEISSVA